MFTCIVSDEDLVMPARAPVAAHNVNGAAYDCRKDGHRVVVAREPSLDAVAAVVDYHLWLSKAYTKIFHLTYTLNNTIMRL